jgi:hypothetical protein
MGAGRRKRTTHAIKNYISTSAPKDWVYSITKGSVQCPAHEYAPGLIDHRLRILSITRISGKYESDTGDAIGLASLESFYGA